MNIGHTFFPLNRVSCAINCMHDHKIRARFRMDSNRSREPDNSNPDGAGQQTAFPTYGSVQADDDSGKEQSPPPSEEGKKKRGLTSSIVSLSSFRDVSTRLNRATYR